MRKSRYSPAQIIKVLQEAEAGAKMDVGQCAGTVERPRHGVAFRPDSGLGRSDRGEEQ